MSKIMSNIEMLRKIQAEKSVEKCLSRGDDKSTVYFQKKKKRK